MTRDKYQMEKDGESVFLKKLLQQELDNNILESFKNYLDNSIVVDLYNSRQSDKEDDFKNPKITYDNDLVNEINEFLEKYNFEFKLSEVSGHCQKEELYFMKQDIDVLIPFEMESIGNKTLMYLLPIINKVLKNDGMIIFDEFGSGMHNVLEELLVRHFMKSSNNSQIFIVSHSTNLLSQNLLRPDQIVSIDSEKGGSIVYKFSTERPRSSQNLEKMYLGGVFGGLPNINKK